MTSRSSTGAEGATDTSLAATPQDNSATTQRPALKARLIRTSPRYQLRLQRYVDVGAVDSGPGALPPGYYEEAPSARAFAGVTMRSCRPAIASSLPAALLLTSALFLLTSLSFAADLDITTTPTGAALFLDNTYVGTAPVKVPDVAPGKHILRAERRGHVPLRRAVEIKDGTQSLNLKLHREGKASLTLTTDPPDAHVYLDGEYRGTTPLKLKDLPPNGYSLRIEKVNFTPLAEHVDLADGDEKTLDRKLASRSVDFYLVQIESDPERVVNYTELSHLYMLQHRFDDAYEVLLRGLKAAGAPKADTEEIRRLYAEVEKIWEGQYEFATEEELQTLRPRLKSTLETAVLEDPSNPYNYQALGQIFRQEDNVQGALDLFQKAYDRVTEPMVKKQLEREISRSLYQQAKAHEKAKDYDKAIAQYRSIIDRFPKSANARNALYQLGSLYNYRLKDTEKAAAVRREHIERFPDSDKCPSMLSEIASVYRRAKQYDKAIATYRQLIEDYPDYDGCPDAQAMIATLYASNLKDREQAVKEQLRFIELFPDSDRCANAYHQLGSLYRQLDKPEESKQAYATLVEKYPLSQYAYYQRRPTMDREYTRKLSKDWSVAAKLVKAKKYEEAAAAYAKVRDDYADTYYAVQAQTQLIRVVGRYLKDPVREREEQRRFMELFPNNDTCASIQYQICYAHYRAKEWDDAIREYETFLRLFPKDDRCPQFLSTIGTIQMYYLKQYADAIRTYHRLIRDYPTYDGIPRAWRYIGDCHAFLDQLKEAKAAYNHVIEQFPDSEDAYDAWRALRRLP